MRFGFALFFSFISIAGWSKPAAKKLPPIKWTFEALRLTGESVGTHDRAVKRLLKIPQLKKMLRQELGGPRKNLALDVISALGFDDFIPELLELAKTENSGIYYLSIASLLTSQNKTSVEAVYRERLLCAKTCGVSPVAQVLMLDTLAQLGEKLSPLELQKIYDEGWYEVKSAALSYARTFLLKGESTEFIIQVNNCLESPILQLRWQAIYLTRELPSNLRARLITTLKKCELVKDQRTPLEVKKLCVALIGGGAR